MVQRSAPARPDAMRRHNLALMLGEIHRDGALTRAELTRRLGMSRSTVGGLVADLVDLGLVEESVPSGNVRAGRPSHVVEPAACGPYALAVDIDVTGVTVAAVGIGGRVLARRSTDWPKSGAPSPARAVATVAHLVDDLARSVPEGGPVAVGVSVPGVVREGEGEVTLAPNLNWHAVPLRDLLARKISAQPPVRLGNDADLAVLAEHRRGSGRSVDDLVFLIGRVGIGAGIVVNGRLLVGRSGRGGEIGHNVMDLRGRRCHCGLRGCFETYVGDVALLAAAGRTGPPTAANVGAVLDAAAAGERRALAAARRTATSLGQGVASLVNTIDPQRVILGGSLARVLDVAERELLAALDRFTFGAGPAVEIVRPELGSDSSLIGAAEIAFESLLADPLSAGRLRNRPAARMRSVPARVAT